MFFKHFEWCVLLALFNCNTVLHVLFWFDCGDGCVLMIFSFWWTCLFSICRFLCWTCVCYLSFFLYLGMLVLCGYLLVIFGTCVCVLLELFALGHVSCVFTCASWILLSIPYIRGTGLCLFELVLWCFLLATTVLLERCFCYLCDDFVSNCFYSSMSKCKLQTVGLFHG